MEGLWPSSIPNFSTEVANLRGNGQATFLWHRTSLQRSKSFKPSLLLQFETVLEAVDPLRNFGRLRKQHVH